jgi:hypothetical protein
MTLHYYHFQAAPRGMTRTYFWGGPIWPDELGYASDFVPLYASKGSDTSQPDQATYFSAVSDYVRPSFRYFYNSHDWMTYSSIWGAYNSTSVGINKSVAWFRQVKNLFGNGLLPDFFAGHYYCDMNSADTATSWVGENPGCGTVHDSRHAIEFSVDPSFTPNWTSWE